MHSILHYGDPDCIIYGKAIYMGYCQWINNFILCFHNISRWSKFSCCIQLLVYILVLCLYVFVVAYMPMRYNFYQVSGHARYTLYTQSVVLFCLVRFYFLPSNVWKISMYIYIYTDSPFYIISNSSLENPARHQIQFKWRI